MNYKILIDDDEPANTRTLERMFKEHYDVVSAQSGAEALELLNVHDVALIISDQRMPGMTGVEFLKRSAEVRPHCVRLILTGYTDAADLVEALNSGVVYKFVTKPWVNADLLQTVKRGLSHYETIKAQHRLNLENERIRGRLTGLEESLVKVCTALVGLRNEEWRERAPRVRDLTVTFGKTLQLSSSSLSTLSQAAYLHGMADVFVPRGLAFRKGQFTENEKAYVISTREQGLAMLKDLTDSEEILLAIRHIPEHYDGTGWPNGLVGMQIPISSRIIAIAKAYDEMTVSDSDSVGHSEAEAIAELRTASGRRFDPAIVNSFCGLVAIEGNQRTIFPSEVSELLAAV
jgi:response regulator RpfG family c-di-GMP phosphodiesterase